MPKKKPAPKKVEEVVEEEVEEEEQVTCPVCGKPVGLSVASCPFCGAEFEEEAIEEIVEEAAEEPQAQSSPPAEAEEAVDEDEMAECPVCGTMVSLNVPSCPSCGAEFEEEEIEEIVEVEEAPEEARPAKARPSKVVAEDEEVYVEEEPAREYAAPSSSILDLRVVGVSLIILGILGAQVAFMINWYWTWVPPIGENLGLFISIPAVVVVAGLLVFMLIKRSASGRRKRVPSLVPSLALSVFLFGILALILIMLWDPINAALKDSSMGVGGAFIAVLVVGVVAVFMGRRTAAPKGSY